MELELVKHLCVKGINLLSKLTYIGICSDKAAITSQCVIGYTRYNDPKDSIQ